uniref:Putative cobyrinic acid A,C-diamide synthase n=1 Tax=Myxococcus fulvus TaxID=33 RepID=B0YR31_MYXFU|nr:putative cobyrinic acid A,C-diamide synthase [Myxococcus fulvus]
MIVAVVSQKGGVSKSSLTCAIAWELHARGSSVLVVDADPQGTVRQSGQVSADEGRAMPTIVAMGETMFRPDQLPRLARSYDHVIVDTPGRSDEVQRAALMVADLALIPCGQSAPDGWATVPTVELVQRAQRARPDLAVALVLTMCLPRTVVGRSARDVVAEAGIPVLSASTTHRIAWQEALAAGVGVAQYAPHDKAADEARAVVDELLVLTGEKQARKRRTTKRKGS